MRNLGPVFSTSSLTNCTLLHLGPIEMACEFVSHASAPPETHVALIKTASRPRRLPPPNSMLDSSKFLDAGLGFFL